MTGIRKPDNAATPALPVSMASNVHHLFLVRNMFFLP
jgi:hypothetical protein